MIQDYFNLVGRNVKYRGLRSWLTVLGILIGISSIVALVSVSQGMEDTVKEQFEKMGVNKLIVMPGGEIEGMPAMAGMMMAEPLTEDDAEAIEKVKGVDVVSPILSEIAKVRFGRETEYAFIHAWPMGGRKDIWEDYFEIEDGRNLEKDDKNRVVVGSDINDVFDKEVKVGSKLEVEGRKFEVVGIFKKTGGKDDDLGLYLTLETGQELFDSEDIAAIIVQAKEGFKPTELAGDIKKELRRHKGEKEGDETFQIQTFEQMLDIFNVILDVLRAVLIAIAGISLIVGGVGIMNTMYTSVMERTREIGIMKAVGARNSDILMLFLLESGIYGLIGGIMGVILGLGMSKTAELIAAQSLGTGVFQVSMAWWLILGALTFSFSIGCVSGILPARQASKLKPVDALRYE
ncbi:MAG: ABC transporter permease [Candidatus Altiarchaeales archaeon]|nr:ABC transporter permease [Candidatus Altiarchaeales archaeon]